MKKFKLFLNFDKEEKWLNEMASQGWELNGVSFNYKFREISSKDTTIKIDCRSFKSKSDYTDYILLFNDSGWEHIAGTRSSGKQYFKKISDNGDTDIFSDITSKRLRYKMLSDMWLYTAISYIPIAVSLILTKAVDASALLNPKLLYYTPGLWERTGVSFWFAFLFETPFVILRAFIWWLFPILIILYLFFSYKANKLISKG